MNTHTKNIFFRCATQLTVCYHISKWVFCKHFGRREIANKHQSKLLIRWFSLLAKQMNKFRFGLFYYDLQKGKKKHVHSQLLCVLATLDIFLILIRNFSHSSCQIDRSVKNLGKISNWSRQSNKISNELQLLNFFSFSTYAFSH